VQNEALLHVLRTVRQPWRSSARRWLGRIYPPSRDPAPPLTGCAGPTGSVGSGPLTTLLAICLIHEAGGLAFLAHPLESLGSFKRLEEALDWLQPEGLDGLEVFHRSYPEGVRSALLALAVRRSQPRRGRSERAMAADDHIPKQRPGAGAPAGLFEREGDLRRGVEHHRAIQA
jgi:hypothetical protein